MRIRPVFWLLAGISLLCGGMLLLPVETARAEENILRLHVIANSDSEADQAAKLRVRDAILAYEDGRLDTQSAASVRRGVLADGRGLLSVVQESLQESGMNYGAKLALGRYPFPERTYGGTIYPAGEYAALRVVLGEGAGQNWWCVLFPPLCILELPDGEIEDEEMQSLILKLWKEGKNKDDTDG
ncbi:MAG: stage II sporulation protein R [Candidatus Pelethousia sp.]|nr:stage II sporulation protein R [Candidatus Pelethousia sp.]